MWWLYCLLTLTVIAPESWSASLPAKETYIDTPYIPDYPIYPDYYIPFSVPGQLVEGITITDILHAIGDVIRADNIIGGASRACRRLGPAISDLISNSRSQLPIGQICEYFEVLDVEQVCSDLWIQLATEAGREDLVDGSQTVLLRSQCRDHDHGDYDYSYPNYWNLTILDEGFPPILERQIDTTSLDDVNLYDLCSQSGIEKVNNIVFALVHWLGPSLLDSISGEGSFSTCGLMRYILSMDVDDFINNIIGVGKFVVADILELIQPFNICALSSEPGGESIGIVIDLLVAFAGLNEDQFCDFIAEEQTREDYLEQGQIFLSNIVFLIHNEQRCKNVLSVIAPLDEFGYFYKITGFNATTETQRDEFCAVLVDAYSPSSSYVPTPYVLPPGVDLENIEPFDTPGEFLPGLTFVDLLRIDGAELNSEKVVDAFAVTCTVFEDFVSSLIEEEQFDVRGFCAGVRHRALEDLEKFCLAEQIQDESKTYHLLGLRPFYYESVFFYIAAEISGIDDISREEVCSAADDLLTNHSFYDLLAQVTDIFLTEALPSIYGVCKNWDEARCNLKPYCPVPEQPTEVPGVTEPPYYYYLRPYVPPPEYIEEANAHFDRIFDGLASIAWLITGFDGQEEACAFVADAIDPLSGRGESASAEVGRNQILSFFADVGRCSEAVDIALGLIEEEDLQQILTQGNTDIVYQITGYDTSREFCQDVAEAFAASGPSATEAPGTGGQLVANIKVIADIAVYIQRATRSIRSL